MATSNSNQTVVPQAKQLLNTMKYEVASEIGVNLKQGYNGDIPAREAGRVGGNMVKKMIQYAESSMPGGKF
ncbi:MAG: alpha/beta-type small acid-soluble spore protein [Christensenellaceae bacterium]|nr:alpha/beta-type small acid-soluble spore protein [Christensenellaceae bacterium]